MSAGPAQVRQPSVTVAAGVGRGVAHLALGTAGARPRPMPRFAVALVALPTLLAACSEPTGSTDIAPTLRFADRTDAEIVRLINAAGGTEMFQAEGTFGSYDDSDPGGDPCPAIAVVDEAATITGGCSTSDGVAIAGTLTIDNPLGFDQLDYDYRADTVYRAAGFSLTDGGQTISFDGELRRADQFATWDADLVVTIGGVALRSDLFYHCTNPDNPRCTLSGSGLELIGVGGARVSGQVAIDRAAGRQTASFTLRGVDVLHVATADGCVAWSIEGTDRGRTCP